MRCILTTLAVGVLLCGTARATATDTRIEAQIRESYAFTELIKGTGTKVESRESCVFLTGTVLREADKALAGETVAAIPDVNRFTNRLSLKSNPATKDENYPLAPRVEAFLEYHGVFGANLKSEARQGVVTLTGSVVAPEQIELVQEFVRDLEGVSSVKASLTVSPDGAPRSRISIDDASLTGIIGTLLEMHQTSAGLKIKISSKNGVVTLTGNVPEFALKAKISQIVESIFGVVKVVNRLAVRTY